MAEKQTSNTYDPDYAVHPGTYLEEIVEARELSQKDLAERCGMSEKQISQIINGKALISTQTALSLEKALGVSADIWNNMSAFYGLFLAKKGEQEAIRANPDWIKRFPTSELKKQGQLSPTTDTVKLTDEVLSFFGVSSISVWEDYYEKRAVNYKRSEAFQEDPYSTAVWLRIAEMSAEKIQTQPYEAKRFRQNLEKIRELTQTAPARFWPEMVRRCAESGVALVLVPELKKTHISGVTKWINPEKALIALSLRYKSNDHFWFCFFHEAGHILLHGKKSVFIETKDSDSRDEETVANQFAQDQLIPRAKLSRFIEAGKFFERDIRWFAESLNIHPGIIVGMLQHMKLIDYRWLNRLKEKFEIVASPNPQEAV